MALEALPNTLVALQSLLAERSLSSEEALSVQASALASRAPGYRCVIAAHDPPKAAGARGPMSGIGLAHKDVFDLKGRAPGCGASNETGPRPQCDAAAIGLLAAAGATNLAVLTMAQFACGATGENLDALEPLNPIDPRAVVGGSSSGSASAVAAVQSLVARCMASEDYAEGRRAFGEKRVPQFKGK